MIEEAKCSECGKVLSSADEGICQQCKTNKDDRKRLLKYYGYYKGEYTGRCTDCGKFIWNVDKRFWRCKECASKLVDLCLTNPKELPPLKVNTVKKKIEIEEIIKLLKEARLFTPAELTRSGSDSPLIIYDSKILAILVILEEIVRKKEG